jgi:hypothetical protein
VFPLGNTSLGILYKGIDLKHSHKQKILEFQNANAGICYKLLQLNKVAKTNNTL